MAEPITIAGAGKTYPGGNRALADVSLDVEPGTFLVLLGPSGSGKTTLLRCLAGIERLTDGQITIGSRTVAARRTHVPPEQRDLSMVFQDYALWPHMTAADNVAFALRRKGLDKAECRRRAAAMLDRVGLGALADRYPNQLSGGEQQRVALARALIAEPGLILADEPLSNLDADLRERMRVEISALVREASATTVYITHDQAEAFALADQVGVLERGRLVQKGTPEEIYTQPATPFVARFTGLAGEMRVLMRGHGADDHAEVAAHGGTGPFRARPVAGGSLRPGDEALLLVRPTGVRLCDPGDSGRHLTGTVTDVAYRGRGYEHAADVPGHGRLTGIFADHRTARGASVGLRFDAAGCHLFPVADAPAPGTPAPAPLPVSLPGTGSSEHTGSIGALIRRPPR